jgi:hypothetical protein
VSHFHLYDRVWAALIGHNEPHYVLDAALGHAAGRNDDAVASERSKIVHMLSSEMPTTWVVPLANIAIDWVVTVQVQVVHRRMIVTVVEQDRQDLENEQGVTVPVVKDTL